MRQASPTPRCPFFWILGTWSANTLLCPLFYQVVGPLSDFLKYAWQGSGWLWRCAFSGPIFDPINFTRSRPTWPILQLSWLFLFFTCIIRCRMNQGMLLVSRFLTLRAGWHCWGCAEHLSGGRLVWPSLAQVNQFQLHSWVCWELCISLIGLMVAMIQVVQCPYAPFSEVPAESGSVLSENSVGTAKGDPCYST